MEHEAEDLWTTKVTVGRDDNKYTGDIVVTMRPTRPAGSLVDFTTGYDFTFTVSVAGTCD